MPHPASPIVLAAAGAVLAALLPSPAARRLGAVGALLLALGAAAAVNAAGDGPLLELAARAATLGVPRSVLAIDLALGVAGLVVLAAACVDRTTAPAPAEADPAPFRRDPLLVLGLVAACLPAILLNALGAGLVLARLPASRWRLVLAITGLLPLATAAWFICTVGGSPLAGLDGYEALPMSTAAQRWAAMPLLLAAFGFAPAVFAPAAEVRRVWWLGAVPLVLAGPGAAAFGLDLLATVAWPLAVLGVTVAVVRRSAWAAAAWLLVLPALTLPEPSTVQWALAAALVLHGLLATPVPTGRWRRVGWAALAVVGTLALPGVLRSEITWTLVLLTGAVVVALRGPAAAR